MQLLILLVFTYQRFSVIRESLNSKYNYTLHSNDGALNFEQKNKLDIDLDELDVDLGKFQDIERNKLLKAYYRFLSQTTRNAFHTSGFPLFIKKYFSANIESQKIAVSFVALAFLSTGLTLPSHITQSNYRYEVANDRGAILFPGQNQTTTTQTVNYSTASIYSTINSTGKSEIPNNAIGNQVADQLEINSVQTVTKETAEYYESDFDDDASAEERAEVIAFFETQGRKKESNLVKATQLLEQGNKAFRNLESPIPKIKQEESTLNTQAGDFQGESKPNRINASAEPDVILTINTATLNLPPGERPTLADFASIDNNELDFIVDAALENQNNPAENVNTPVLINDITTEEITSQSSEPSFVSISASPSAAAPQTVPEFNDFGFDFPLDDDNDTNAGSSELESPNSNEDTNNTVENTSEFEISWLENFDGPALDLRRFITPGTQLIAEQDILSLNLEATHAGKNQEVFLQQQLSLADVSSSVGAKLTLLDSSSSTLSVSQFTVKIPLERIENTGNPNSEIVACVLLSSLQENEAKTVKLIVYEGTSCLNPSDDTATLGETSFRVRNSDLSSKENIINLNFSLDTSNPNYIVLSADETSLNIPIAAQFPTQEANLNVRLSATGAAGEFSRIDASISELSINNGNLSAIDEQLINNNTTATIGHSLDIREGAARLGATALEEPARVLLATRSELSEADLFRDSRSTKFTTDLLLDELGLNSSGFEATDFNQSSLNIFHILFDTPTQDGDRQIIAVLNGKPAESSNSSRITFDVTASLLSVPTSVDGEIDWYNIQDEQIIIAEELLVEDVVLDTKAPVTINYDGYSVSFSWADAVIQLSHNHETRWNPSAKSTTAALALAEPGQAIILKLDRMAVTRR